MCVAAPMRLVSIEGDSGRAELGGVSREISLALLPGAKEGDYVLVHAGFAIGKVDEDEARLALEALAAISDGPEGPERHCGEDEKGRAGARGRSAHRAEGQGARHG